MNVSKKIFIYILAGMLSICSVSSCYCRSVYAIEWAGGALAFEEALKWAMALLGVTATTGMTNAYWEQYGDDFTEYAIENGSTQTQVAEWQLKLCQGILDKGSVVWSTFKVWCKSLVQEVTGNDPSPEVGANTDDVLRYINNYFGSSIDSTGLQVKPCYAFAITFNSDGSLLSAMLFTNNIYDYRITETSGGGSYYINSGRLVEFQYKYSWDNWRRQSGNNGININSNTFISSNIINTTDNYFGIVPFGASSGGETGDENFQGLQDVDQENLDVISSVTGDEDDTEVSIPMPGVGTSDNDISSDAYDDLIDAINSGEISLEDGIARVQDILKVIVFDDTTEEIIPPEIDPDTGENKKKDDVLKEVKENMGFTLAGLENVFPFCIPWDIYAFMSLLVANPVAPVFQIPFPNVNDPAHPLTQEVDLSDWDEAMRLVRLAEDFVFIIGLMFATRSLIGAGGGD